METTVYSQAYLDYQLSRSPFRFWVRQNFYLKNMLRFAQGKVLDLGCGLGEFISLSPAGSLGLEINTETVRFGREQGLNIDYYDVSTDDYAFQGIPAGVYRTFVMSHVLEHLPDPATVVRKVMDACDRLGIETLIFVVPGVKGFQSDKTHLTFIDKDFFCDHALNEIGNYRVIHQQYFPFDSKWFSRYFTHNELMTVYQKW